jgi:hypothetical protein
MTGAVAILRDELPSRLRLFPLKVAALCAVCAAVAAPALGNGDPASHYLPTDAVFYPFESKVSPEARRELARVLAAAKGAGFEVRVALIATEVDLGLVPELYRQPQEYAELLGKEIRADYRGHVLTAMPNGYGVFLASGTAEEDRELVADLPEPGTTDANALAVGATSAVRALAGARGLELETPAAPSSSSDRVDRLQILAVVVIVLAAGVAIRLLQRRPRREQPDAQ